MFRSTVLLLSFFAFTCCQAHSPKPAAPQPPESPAKKAWVDSVYKKLSEEERIGQLFMVAAYSGTDKANRAQIESLIRNHQIGGVIFMQGGPLRQAEQYNHFQQMAQVPLLVAMDAEWGLGMRLDSVINFPKQMTLGAADDTSICYRMGMAVAQQCRRLGVHINFAPVVDVNNNPANPVINARSFGEDKYRVSRLATAYMRGMQDYGVIACAKHFPGHGDVSVDSHKDLPVINKSKASLDSLELYPFRQLIGKGVKSIMLAHLSVPALESEPNVPTTLSRNTVTGLLREEMGFDGLIFTDALDMKGVSKFYQPGELNVKAVAAGNDVLLFAQDVPGSIVSIAEAIKSGKLDGAAVEKSVRRILGAKYDVGLNKFKPVSTDNLTADLNSVTANLNARAAKAAITVVRDKNQLLPLSDKKRILYVSINANTDKKLEVALRKIATGEFRSIAVMPGNSASSAESAISSESWDAVLLTVRGLSFYPGKQYGLTDDVIQFLSRISSKPKLIAAVMGNAYALKYVCSAETMICGFEDNEWTNDALSDLLSGRLKAKGNLPVRPPCLNAK
jgi:beta-glucosidase-like glycosyl hydrolase